VQLTCLRATLLLMQRRLSTPNLPTNSNFTNVILVEKTPSFLIPIISALNSHTALNKSILKETALPLILLPLLRLYLIGYASKATEKTPSKSHLKHPSSATNSSTLNAKEDSFQELWTMPNFTDLLIPSAHLTIQPQKILLRLVQKNWETVRESTLEITVSLHKHKTSSFKSSTMVQLSPLFQFTEISSFTKKDFIKSTPKTKSTQLSKPWR